MRHLHGFIKRVSLKRLAAIVLCCSVIFVAVSTVRAQSGRRVSKKKSVSVAPPEATPPEAKPSAPPPVVKADQAQLSLYVSMSQRDPFIRIPLHLYDSLRKVFVQRLREASAINVKVGEELNRTEAIKRAKAEANTHVVLLELEAGTFDPRGPDGSNIDESRLLVHYTVFAPSTGKVKLEGRVYQQQYRAGRGGIGLPSRNRNNPLYSDYRLKEAAREAANRVLESFSVYRPRESRNEVGK